jgi:DNA-binding response OmpR family regulator
LPSRNIGPVRPSRPLHVLVVDDDAPTRDLLEALLTDEAFSVTCTANAAAALTSLTEHEPDVILLDIMMPETSGFDLMSEVRTRANIPIIFLSARGGENDRAHGLHMGADDYIVKPFGGAELVARIHAVLRESSHKASPTPRRPNLRRG